MNEEVVDNLCMHKALDSQPQNDHKFALAYVSGWVLKKLSIDEITCEECRGNMLENNLSFDHLYVEFKEYAQNEKHLTYASENFMDLIDSIHEDLYMFLRNNAHLQNLEDRFTDLYIKNKKKLQFLYKA